ncbi:MAG: hypothetical protein COA52_18955 [Hyphomicrobiales bacterium]|nr:MAG: hypothetical protein COA52_18955 [Hyphomicrobiales bacterium]
MDYRRIGGTDLDVSVLCFGPMRSAAKDGNDNDVSKEGARALEAALASGVNFLHSSYEYKTRWMMTDVLRKHPKRNDIHHVIKLPVPDWDDGSFSEAKFRMRVEEALDELATDRIAVLQWMWRIRPDDDEHRLKMLADVMDDMYAAFEKLRDEGKVGYLMTLPYTVASARAALDTGKFSGLISFHNPIEMDMAEFFPQMERDNQGFLCIRPLYQSILSDKRTSWDEVPEGHYLQRVRKENPNAFAQRKAIAETFADEIGDSMTKFALRFPLYSPIVASMITGLNSVEQVEQAVATLDGIEAKPELFKKAHDLWKADFKT